MISLAWLVISSLLWGAALLGAGLLLQRLSDLSGSARQWIWRGVAVLLVAPWIAAPLVSGLGLGLAPRVDAPVFDVLGIGAVASVEPGAADATSVFLPVSDVAALTAAPLRSFALPEIDWEGTLLAVLIAGWLVRFVMAQFAARQLGGVVANSRPVEAGVAKDALEAWSARLSLKRKPELRVVEANVSPFSYGVVRPVICLPEGLDDKLGREPLQLVVAHECLHVARGDGWLRPIERVVADIFWFNPFAWAARRELDMARELACDEGVVELSSARHAYARTLRDVAGLSAGLSASAPAASMSLAGGGRAVVLRVKRTLALAKRKPARAALVAAVVLGLVGAPIAVAQVVLSTPRPLAAPEAPEVTEIPEPPEPLEVAAARAAPAAPAAPVAPADEAAPAAEPSPVAEPTPAPAPRAVPSVPVVQQTPAPPSPPVAPRVELQLDGVTAPVVRGAARVTSPYGMRTDPNTQQAVFHDGTDVAFSYASPIHAPANGYVSFTGVEGDDGRVVVLDLTDGVSMRFGHLDAIKTTKGDQVEAGDVIATMGSSGRSTGSHVHVEVWKDGKQVDPQSIHGLTLIGPLPPTPSAVPGAIAPTPPTPRAMPAPQQAPAPREVRADRKTELIALDGRRVDRILLRYDFNGTWLVDTQNILYRDDARGYYLVTLKEACKQLDIRSLRFRLYPSWSWQLRADRSYDVRPEVGSPCDVARIAQVDRARADALREASQRRIW